LKDIEAAAKEREIARSRFIADCITTYFAPKELSTNVVALLTKDLEHIKELAARDAEIAELKEAIGWPWSEWHDANARLVQYQLPAPTSRGGFWSRFRQKKSRGLRKWTKTRSKRNIGRGVNACSLSDQSNFIGKHSI